MGGGQLLSRRSIGRPSCRPNSRSPRRRDRLPVFISVTAGNAALFLEGLRLRALCPREANDIFQPNTGDRIRVETSFGSHSIYVGGKLPLVVRSAQLVDTVAAVLPMPEVRQSTAAAQAPMVGQMRLF